MRLSSSSIFLDTWPQLRAYLQQQPSWRGGIPLLTADGTLTELTLPVELWTDEVHRPVVILLDAGTIVPYSDDDPPPAGCWHLRLHPQKAIFGTAPTADPKTQLLLAALTV